MCKAFRIKDLPGYYIADNGEVYSRIITKRHNLEGRIKKLKQQQQNSGYFLVQIHINGKRYAKTVHRIVAKTFIPNPSQKKLVNHKNGIKTDNRAENLEWATESENMKHSFDVLGRNPTWIGKRGKDHPRSKRVLQLKKGGVIANFEGVLDASRKTGINSGDISRCCLGKRKSAGGYQWKYLPDSAYVRGLYEQGGM